jgi:hypothetical protein
MRIGKSLKIVWVCVLAVTIFAPVGCSSVMDPTNAQARADKMQKAVEAQKHNGMMTAPKSNPQSPN